MAKIATGDVDVYVRQLLSEALVDNVGSHIQAEDDKILKDENFKLTHRRLSEKPKDK